MLSQRAVLPSQMAKLLLLPPSVIANSALVNKLSLGEVHSSTTYFIPQQPTFLNVFDYSFVLSISFQIQAACSVGLCSADVSACSDASRIVRQLCISALDSGDVDCWKATVLQESDLDAAHVEAIAQAVQVTRLNHFPRLHLTTYRHILGRRVRFEFDRLSRSVHSHQPRAEPLTCTFLQLQRINWNVSLAVASSVEDAAPQG